MADAILHKNSETALNRRAMLTGGVAAAAATATLAVPALASTEQGPIEKLWREYVRREEWIAARLRNDPDDDDITPGENAWSFGTLYEAAKLRPTTEREWAAMTLVALFCTTLYDSKHVDTVLETLRDIFGSDAQVERALV